MSALAILAALQASSPLSVHADQTTVFGFYDGESHIGEAGPVTLTISGGVGAKAVTWSYVSGTPVTVSPTVHDVSVSFLSGSSLGAVYRATVSDDGGHTVSVDVTISIS